MPFDNGSSPFYNGMMQMTLTLDKAGRVVIPKELRDALHISAGDRMELRTEGEGFSLRPIRGASALRKQQGVWVFHGAGTLNAAATDAQLQAARGGRDDAIRQPRG